MPEVASRRVQDDATGRSAAFVVLSLRFFSRVSHKDRNSLVLRQASVLQLDMHNAVESLLADLFLVMKKKTQKKSKNYP